MATRKRSARPKGSAAKPAGKAPKKGATKSTKLSDKDAVELAKQHVPPRLHGSAKVIRHDKETPAAKRLAGAGPGAGAGADEDMTLLAKRLGVKLKDHDPADVDVEFADMTRLGSRSTIVQIRNGQVARVIKAG